MPCRAGATSQEPAALPVEVRCGFAGRSQADARLRTGLHVIQVRHVDVAGPAYPQRAFAGRKDPVIGAQAGARFESIGGRSSVVTAPSS